MDFLFMGIAAVLIIAALLYLKKSYERQNSLPKKKNISDATFANCPVCGTPLHLGENIVSKVFRAQNQENDQLCYIYGCPFCYPVAKSGVKRACPVCKKDVGQEQYLLARRFNKTKSGKPHVIVNGCGNCNRK